MIKEFQKEYRWLSNFVPCEIIIDGIIYHSVEAAYMSAKSNDLKWKMFCSNPDNSPGFIKKKSKEISLIENWEEIKIEIMKTCLEQKFKQEPYKSLLKETGNSHIQEGNMWNDKFWGVCLKTNQGENNLGKLIMEIRSSL